MKREFNVWIKDNVKDRNLNGKTEGTTAIEFLINGRTSRTPAITEEEMLLVFKSLSIWEKYKAFTDRVAKALQTTYDHIGEDLFVNDTGEFDPKVTYSWEEIGELCCDADKPVYNGGLSKEDYNEFLCLSSEDQKKIIRKAFPNKRYRY